MKIEAEIRSLEDILTNNKQFYQIPDYQRPYSWDKDNVSDLVEDLVDAYLNKNEEDYFCGSLVLVGNGRNERYDIIDGQQRTTTFIIMACVIRDLYWDSLNEKSKDFIKASIQDKYDESKEKLRFLTDEKYQNNFMQTILNGIKFKENINIEKEFKNNKYLQNAHYIKEFIQEKITMQEININNFVIWIYENVVLTYIVCPSQDSAIQIFNVLNDRGMPLSPVDILKSYLMNTLQEEEKQSFKRDWETIIDLLKNIDVSLDDMLNTYLYYKIESNPKTTLDKELKEVIKIEKTTSLEVIYEMNLFSNAYKNLLTMEDKYIYSLKYLKHKIYWHSILTTAIFIEYKELEELKKVLVAYYYQNWIAGATRARIKQTSFNILKLVKKNENIDKIKEEIIKNLNKYNTTKIFKENIDSNDIYNKPWIKALFLLIEYFMDDANHPTFQPINKKLQLEHILPQTPSDYWKNIFNKEEREEWTNSLSNLTLLAMKKNLQAQNYTFEEKKNIYKNKNDQITSFKLTQEILDYNKWDINSLQNRKEKLINRINNKLDIF